MFVTGRRNTVTESLVEVFGFSEPNEFEMGVIVVSDEHDIEYLKPAFNAENTLVILLDENANVQGDYTVSLLKDSENADDTLDIPTIGKWFSPNYGMTELAKPVFYRDEQKSIMRTAEELGIKRDEGVPVIPLTHTLHADLGTLVDSSPPSPSSDEPEQAWKLTTFTWIVVYDERWTGTPIEGLQNSIPIEDYDAETARELAESLQEDTDWTWRTKIKTTEPEEFAERIWKLWLELG